VLNSKAYPKRLLLAANAACNGSGSVSPIPGPALNGLFKVEQFPLTREGNYPAGS
jgi:hypothetical protein